RSGAGELEGSRGLERSQALGAGNGLRAFPTSAGETTGGVGRAPIEDDVISGIGRARGAGEAHGGRRTVTRAAVLRAAAAGLGRRARSISAAGSGRAAGGSASGVVSAASDERGGDTPDKRPSHSELQPQRSPHACATQQSQGPGRPVV